MTIYGKIMKGKKIIKGNLLGESNFGEGIWVVISVSILEGEFFKSRKSFLHPYHDIYLSGPRVRTTKLFLRNSHEWLVYGLSY